MDQPIIRSSEVLVHMRAMMMMLFLDFHISIHNILLYDDNTHTQYNRTNTQ